MLRNLPFLAELPQRFFDLVVAKGLLLKYDKDDVIWAPPEAGEEEDDTSGGAPSERSGIFIVIAGLISRSFRNADGKTEVGCGTLCRFTGSTHARRKHGPLEVSDRHLSPDLVQELLMGSGGVFGLTTALVGESVPGSGPAVAIGNALSQGPVVFHWPQHVIDDIERQARSGAGPEWMQLCVDLFRLYPIFATGSHRKPRQQFPACPLTGLVRSI